MKSTNQGKPETVQVIGAGWGRTGTASLKKALEILGYDPTYHMMEVMKRPQQAYLWMKAQDAVEAKQSYDFDNIFICENGKEKYTATCDFPSAKFWKEQLQQYPSAKVILTVRAEEKWFASVRETIFRQQIQGGLYGISFLNFIGLFPIKQEFLDKVLYHGVFDNDFSKPNMIDRYKKHNEKVKKECPKDQLLVFEVSQGWEPLCKFLNKPIPSEPFPNVNDTESFRTLFNRFNMIGYAAFALVVSLPVVLGILTRKYIL
jgi:hypothetical protein